MDGVREYFISITAAAVLCACVRSIAGDKGTAARIVKLICGLFLAFTVIQPVAEVKITDLVIFTADIQAEADAAVSTGEDFARESMAGIIKSETEAYILDKAQAFRAAIQVEVTVSDDIQPVPQEVRITGSVSPYVRAQLQSIIENDLGITKEDQIWIG